MAYTIDDYKKQYESARVAGDALGMRNANDAANQLRNANGEAAQYANADIANVAKQAQGDTTEEDREAHEKKPMNKKDDDDDNSPPPMKEIKQSTTDPQSGFMHRDGKPKGFFYLDHRTVDSKANIITDVYVTPGNINDVEPYTERLKTQISKFGFETEYVGLDAGYNTNIICRDLSRMDIIGAMGYRRGCQPKGKYGKFKFTYLSGWDTYVCPERCYLCYRPINHKYLFFHHYLGNHYECFLIYSLYFVFDCIPT
jgi:hypothetical protein